MKHNNCKEKLLSGEIVVGIWSIIPSTMVTEILSSTGLDFIILDMEHGAFGITAISDSIRAVVFEYCSPIVRIPKVDPQLIQTLLDVGAHGIVAPQIRNIEDVKELVASSRLYPKGKRGFNPFTKSGDYIGQANTRYYSDDFPILIGIIENMDAYLNLDQLLSVNEIDVWYIGVYDLSCAVGFPGQVDHPEVKKIINDIKFRILQSGKKVGCMIDKYIKMDSSEAVFQVLKPDTYQLKSHIKNLIYEKR